MNRNNQNITHLVSANIEVPPAPFRAASDEGSLDGRTAASRSVSSGVEDRSSSWSSTPLSNFGSIICFRAWSPRNYLVLMICGILASCAAHQIRPHSPRERQYDIGEYEASPEPVSGGSLWTNASSGLFADFRARSVGDIVTIRIDETARASGDASTETEREQSMSFGLPNFLGLTAALQQAHPDIDPSNLIQLMSEHDFTAQGETSRGSRVRGTLAVRVRRELPNHDLYIEGTKVILVNDEELHIYISGVIRPEDIEQDNSVRSSLVADAQIQFSGRGSLSENNERGWLARLLSRVRPF